MLMELRTLRAFVEVVRQGGFSRAGKVVFATQPTISKAIKQLEDELGVPLLNRVGHVSEPTAAGEIVYRRALAMLAERDDLIAELDELRGMKRGVLSLGLPPLGSSTLFAPLFATYRSRYPGIFIRLIEHGSKRLEERLLAGDIELAATLLPVAPELDWQEVRVEPLMVLLPSDHALARKRKIEIASLAGSPFILFDEGFAINHLILDACRRRGFTPSIVARSAQVEFIVELVAVGFGIAFLPRMMAEARHHPSVRHALLDEPGTDWRIALVWRRGGFLSHAARAWLALAREAHPVTDTRGHVRENPQP
jgi:DNA-binding transcriptional LysR family regulator